MSDTASLQTSKRASVSRNSKRLSLSSISFTNDDEDNVVNKDDVLSNTKTMADNDSQRAFRPLRNFTPRSSVSKNLHKVSSKTLAK